VEDDDAVRDLATLTLEQYGYTVLPADSGTQALEFLGPLAGLVDLVVTDLIMPRMSGPDLVAQLKHMHPESKVLYISGYTEDATIQHGVLDQGVEFLQKPFTPEGLARKVREVLDNSTA
jgi:CheY-like chemotaxis protein